MWLGVDEMAARRMINVEAFYDETCLVKLDDKRIESTARNIGGGIGLPPSVHMADGFNALVVKFDKAIIIMEIFYVDHAAGGYFVHTQPHE